MTNSEKKFISLRTQVGDYHTAYLELVDHPHEVVAGCVKKTIRVHNLIEGYKGPGIGIDFDEEGRAIGIEILYSYADEDDELKTD
jgi:hypothetical protein